MTDQPRIAPVPYEGDDPPLNIFRTLKHNKPLYKAFLAMGTHLLQGGVLPPREREIVILRVGWRCESEYEFGQHTLMGRAAGLTDEEIVRITDDDADGWTDGDRALIALADDLCIDDVVSDDTWQHLAERWDDAQLLELLVLAGYYRLVSGLLRSAGVQREPYTPGWPA